MAILVAGQREFPSGEIETVNFDICPALVEFGGSEFHAVIIEQQSSRNRFLQQADATALAFASAQIVQPHCSTQRTRFRRLTRLTKR